MKKLFLLLPVLLLIACEESTTQCSKDWVVSDSQSYERVLGLCLDKAAKARSGRDYTTNDDEDYDEVVSACVRAATEVSNQVLVRTCVPTKYIGVEATQ